MSTSVVETGEKPLLAPVTEAGSGSVEATEKAYLSASIEELNTLTEEFRELEAVGHVGDRQIGPRELRVGLAGIYEGARGQDDGARGARQARRLVTAS